MLAVFVTLGIDVPLAPLGQLWGELVVMAVFLLVARPVTVLACLLPDRRGRWLREEIVFLSWCRETGVVPAAWQVCSSTAGSRAPKPYRRWSRSAWLSRCSRRRRRPGRLRDD